MRVILVRPADQAERSAERLRRAGHDPVTAPILHIVATGAAPPAGRFDGAILTSRNAVPALAAFIGRHGDLPVYAVGGRTAEDARAAGLRTVTAFGGDAAYLAERLMHALPAGQTLLHPCGRDRKEEPGRSLRAAGHPVVSWTVYEARAVTQLPDILDLDLRRGGPAAVLHYSRRSASLLASLVRSAGLGQAFGQLEHVCLSEDVAAGLGADGLRIRIAARPDEDGLLAALAQSAGPPHTASGSPAPQSGC